MQIIVYIVAVVLHIQVHELKDIHEKFGGFPDSYDMGNTPIQTTMVDKRAN